MSMAQCKVYYGLENQGYICLNAVLQTLFMTKEFREHVKKKSVSSGDPFIKELNKLFNELETEKKAVSAAEIRKSLGISDEKVDEPRDAAEYLQKILNKTPGSSEEDAVQAHYDKMCGEYQTTCFYCKEKTGSVSSCGMITFPKLLIIQLSKSDDLSRIKVYSRMYQLYAIINYEVKPDRSGHYYADIECEKGIWRRFDDERVSVVFTVNTSNESSTLRSPNAYLLVYRRRE